MLLFSAIGLTPPAMRSFGPSGLIRKRTRERLQNFRFSLFDCFGTFCFRQLLTVNR